MAYKAILGLSEITVGILLAVPSFDPQATFAPRLSAEELREDPSDRLVALISRHLPALLLHRGPVAVGLVVFGLDRVAPDGDVDHRAAPLDRPDRGLEGSREAGRRRRHLSVASPIGPAPNTTAVWPGPIRERRTAWKLTAIGSTSAPRSVGSWPSW
jgi:hypothetical protein